MSDYDIFFKFYDQVMGDREISKRYTRFHQRIAPHTKKVLELACWTGSVLNILSQKYEVSGLDLSEWMLEIASEKLQ